MRKVIVFLGIMFVLIGLSSCASYHDLSAKYQQQLQSQNYQSALTSVDKNKFLKKDRNKLLFYLEKGKLAHINKNYKLSNEYFNKADDFIEFYKKNLANKVLGVITNPEKETYQGEDFEKVAIHYYKALNYIFLNLYDEALVEAKRINLELLKINDSYPEGKKNRYSNDAFALSLQGLIYEATGNINDAFIAYRNAVELYAKQDGSFFGVSMPDQLKHDVINTAHVLGFYAEEARFSKLFGKTYDSNFTKKKSVVVFWENGLIPYKSQTYFTFTAIPGINSNFISFNNQELGLSFNVPRRGSVSNSFSDLNIINVSFPKYEVRPTYYAQALIGVKENEMKRFQLAQNYEEIATKTLKDRTAREIGKLVLRVATKKIAEGVVANQNQNLGAILGLINAFTEKSDTRNWQTLPSKIYYSRIDVENETSLKIKLVDKNGAEKLDNISINPNLKLNFINYITPQINSAN
ncbi:COG3014 family protein [Wenyingzhuangia sp. IMCC45533]